MTPLGTKIVIKPHAAEDVSVGGIIIPEQAKKRPGKATVVFVPQPNNPDILVKPGDVVLLSQDAGAPVFFEDTEHLVIEYAELWCII